MIKYCLVIVQLFLFFAPYESPAQLHYFSFEFKGCSLENALGQISHDTGIEISAPLDSLAGKIINKSYKNLKIESILTDMFQGRNYAIIWNYQEKQLFHVQIQLVESGSLNPNQNDRFYDVPSINKYRHKSQSGKKQNSVTQSSISALQNYNNIGDDNGSMRQPAPDPEKFKGLELPPVPPGIPSVNSYFDNRQK